MFIGAINLLECKILHACILICIFFIDYMVSWGNYGKNSTDNIKLQAIVKNRKNLCKQLFIFKLS